MEVEIYTEYSVQRTDNGDIVKRENDTQRLIVGEPLDNFLTNYVITDYLCNGRYKTEWLSDSELIINTIMMHNSDIVEKHRIKCNTEGVNFRILFKNAHLKKIETVYANTISNIEYEYTLERLAQTHRQKLDSAKESRDARIGKFNKLMN